MKGSKSSIVKFLRKILGTHTVISQQEMQNTVINDLRTTLQELHSTIKIKLEKYYQLYSKQEFFVGKIQNWLNANIAPSVATGFSKSSTSKPDLLYARYGRQIISITDGTRFDLTADFAIFLQMIEDMKLNGKNLVPMGVWDEYSVDTKKMNDITSSAFKEEIHAIFLSKFSTMSLMMDPWVGCVGMQPVSEEQIEIYSPILKKMDHCGLVGDDLLATAKQQKMLNTDLGSLLDVNLLAGFVPLKKNKRFFVLEAGGGYGRLAEALTNALDVDFHYVLVDAVPSSLLYAREYLKKAFPNKKIGFYLTDAYDQSYDFYILPPWHLDRIKSDFDLCINIESMQEMVQEHVDFYLNKFDELVKMDGTVYISNSQNYRFQGTWNFPTCWKMLICHNTPRSWTNAHPTIIFKKTTEDATVNNNIMVGLYMQQVSGWNLRLSASALKNEVARHNNELQLFHQEILSVE